MADLKAASRAIEAFLRALGHAPGETPELEQTGMLVADAFHNDLLAGYQIDPEAVLAERMASDERGLVVVDGIETCVMCPHHLLPAPGTVRVGYVPAGYIIGFGALSRLVDCYARRLALQETVTQQIADALVESLGASAAGCIMDLTPTCLTARGERTHNAHVVTRATAGVMRDDATLRAEFAQVGHREGGGASG